MTLTLSADPERTVTVPLTATPQGDATAGDYTAPASVTFQSGETSAVVTFGATQDEEDDNDEQVVLGFPATLPTGISAGSVNEATVTITDDDAPDRVGVSWGAATYTVAEGETQEITVELDKAPERAVTIGLRAQQRSYTVSAGGLITERVVAWTGGVTAPDFSGVPASVTFGSRGDISDHHVRSDRRRGRRRRRDGGAALRRDVARWDRGRYPVHDDSLDHRQRRACQCVRLLRRDVLHRRRGLHRLRRGQTQPGPGTHRHHPHHRHARRRGRGRRLLGTGRRDLRCRGDVEDHHLRRDRRHGRRRRRERRARLRDAPQRRDGGHALGDHRQDHRRRRPAGHRLLRCGDLHRRRGLHRLRRGEARRGPRTDGRDPDHGHARRRGRGRRLLGRTGERDLQQRRDVEGDHLHRRPTTRSTTTTRPSRSASGRPPPA